MGADGIAARAQVCVLVLSVLFSLTDAFAFTPHTQPFALGVPSASLAGSATASGDFSLTRFGAALEAGRSSGSRCRGIGVSDSRCRGFGLRPLGMAARDSDFEKERARRLRAEAESPFRSVRVFFCASAAASSLIGFLVSFTRLIALYGGVSQGQTESELLTNLAIDLGAFVGSGLLLKRDMDAKANRLERMEVGAMLASLNVRLQLDGDAATVPLSALRRDRGRDKRVVLVVGVKERVQESLVKASQLSKELSSCDIVCVPVVVKKVGEEGVVATGEESSFEEDNMVLGQPHVALPVVLNGWQKWVDLEFKAAIKQGIDDPFDKGLSLVIKKNGRISTRSSGLPPWNVLVGDVQSRADAGLDVKNI